MKRKKIHAKLVEKDATTTAAPLPSKCQKKEYRVQRLAESLSLSPAAYAAPTISVPPPKRATRPASCPASTRLLEAS